MIGPGEAKRLQEVRNNCKTRNQLQGKQTLGAIFVHVTPGVLFVVARYGARYELIVPPAPRQRRRKES